MNNNSKQNICNNKGLLTIALMLFYVWFGGIALAAKTLDTENINPCAIPKGIINAPPDLNGEPVKVSVSVFVLDIIELNEIKESFKIDFTAELRWQDPRLSKVARGASLSSCDLTLNQIWNPEVSAINTRALSQFFFKKLTIDEMGFVSYYVRAHSTLASAFDLREFPFDKQALKIHLTSFDYGPQKVIFLVDEKYTGRLDNIEMAGWRISSNESDVSLPPLVAGGDERTQMFHTIHIERKAGYYIWKFVIPLCFIVLMAGSVFWLDPESFGPQIGISTASVFTLVAFLLGLRQGLPQVAYLTRMDELVLAATVLVFVSFGEVIYVSRLVNKKRSDLARRIDLHARWLYLTVFSILIYVILISPVLK